MPFGGEPLCLHQLLWRKRSLHILEGLASKLISCGGGEVQPLVGLDKILRDSFAPVVREAEVALCVSIPFA